MIYKFTPEEKDGSYLELEKVKDRCRLEFFISGTDCPLWFDVSKETLYEMIGALHSIQTKIRNEHE